MSGSRGGDESGLLAESILHTQGVAAQKSWSAGNRADKQILTRTLRLLSGSRTAPPPSTPPRQMGAVIPVVSTKTHA